MTKIYKPSENDGEKERFALQRLAREELKQKILADVLMDINVCKLEGWDYKEYIKELVDLLSRFI